MTRPPRVLMIAPSFDRIGGYELQAMSLARAFVRRGVSAWLISDNCWSLAPREHRDGVLLYRLSAPQSPWWLQPRWPWQAPDRGHDLAVFLRQHADRYDAVHGCAFCPPSDVAMTAARRLGKPAMVKVATEGDPTEVAQSPEWRATWRGLLDADRLLCISQAIADEFGRLGVPAEKTAHVPNGVDTTAFRPGAPPERRRVRAALGLADDTLAVLNVSRLAQRKGIDVLVRAWADLPAAVRSRATLLLAGDGEERPRLEEAMADLGIAPSVRLLGERRDVSELLRAADVFVFPSRREGLSNALLEALASGLPTVATRIGGNVDLIQDGENGLLCPADDPAALAEAMEQLAIDAGLRRRLGATARQRIVEGYAIDRVVERLLPLYGISVPAPPGARAAA